MIVLDVETTGLDPRKNSIVSIGALDFFFPKNQFYEECRVWDGAEITEKALEINGFSLEEITSAEKKSNKKLIEEFAEWAEKVNSKDFAGENVWFDLEFLKSAFKMHGIEWKFGHRVIDLHTLSYCHHLSKNISIKTNSGKSCLSLDRTLAYVNLPEEPKPHDALTGAKMEAEAFSRIIYGKNLLEEFEKFPVPLYTKT